jgi:hypothetical protein
VLLVTAAGLAISRANLRFEENLVLAVLYVALATITVVVPIVATILAPTWMEPRLLSIKAWIAGHATAISGVMAMLVGVFVIGLGLSG